MKKKGTPISLEQVEKAVCDLYGNWDCLSETSQAFIKNVMVDGRFEQLYEQIAKDEEETKNGLIQIENSYPGTIKETNVDIIAGNLQKSEDRASIIAKLKQR